MQQQQTSTVPGNLWHQLLHNRRSIHSCLLLMLMALITMVCCVQVYIFDYSFYLADSTSMSSSQVPSASSLSANYLSNATSSSSKKQQQSQVNSEWAYVFLLANCDPVNSTPAYRGILYNILAATYMLKHQEHASPADIIVLVQLSHSTNAEGLLPMEEDLMKSMGIQIRYLPKPNKVPTFYELVMAKFHVLTMKEYSKILFLDGDVLPLCNLDYLFSNDSLGDIVLHAMYDDPVNAGLFVVTPRTLEKDFNELMKEWNAFRSTPEPPNVKYRLWKGEEMSGWGFYCGDSDQGFLLYWSLFLQSQQSVSIIVGSKIEQYDAIPNNKSQQRQPARIIASSVLLKYSCLPSGASRKGTWAQNALTEPLASQWPFYQDFYHMVGYSKAWEYLPANWDADAPISELTSTQHHWYHILNRVATRFDPEHFVIPELLGNLHESMENPQIRGDLLFSPNSIV